MQPTPFIAQLAQVLPEDARAQVLAALQATPTLWEALQQHAALAQQALASLGGEPGNWTSGHLTRLLLHLPLSITEAPPADLRQEAARIYAAFRERPHPPDDARTVALLTLVLTEQRRLTGSWAELGTTLGDPEEWVAWQEPFAAAYSLATDQRAMAEALFAHAPWEGFRLLTQALLALPVPAQVQQAHLAAWMQRLDLPRRLQALEHLAHHRPQWLAALHPLWEQAPLPPPYDAWVKGLLSLPSEPESARQWLSQAWDLGRRFQAQVAAELGLLAQEQGDLITAQTAWAQANERLPGEALYLARRILTALALGQLETAYRLLPEKPQHPALLLAAARLSAAHHEPQALSWAQEALQAASHTPLPVDLWADLARLFLDLERPNLALKAARQGLKAHPSAIRLHDLAAEAALRSHNPAQAVEHAALALHLSPSLQRRRLYAQALTQGAYWEEALEAWQQTLQAEPSPSLEQRLTLARVAWKAGRLSLARGTVEDVLQQQPEEAQALALLGEILAAQGDLKAAEAHLREAIRRVPQAANLHLTLAQVLQQQGRADEALETLRLATQSLPQSAALQAALGRAFLQRGRFAQALPPLQKAYRLAPNTDPYLVLDLGKVLLHLRRVDEALALLQEAHHRYPDLPGLKALLGEAFIQAGEPHQAVPLLAQAVQQGPLTPPLALHYARAVLAAGEDASTVVHLLQQHRAWLSDPQIPPALRAELRLVFARALEALGDHDQALDLYREVSDSEALPRLMAEVAKGLARTALATTQPSLAIAALESLREEQSLDAESIHLLSQAYAEAGLAEKALEVAALPFQNRPPTPEEALAFAELAQRLAHATQAIPVLERAQKAFPGEPRLPLKLAEIYLDDGQHALAGDVLRAVLRTAHQPPLPPEMLATLGQRLLQAGDSEGAAQALAQALEATPSGKGDWWLALVKASQNQGAHALALEKAQQALQECCGEQPFDPTFLAEMHLLRLDSFLALKQAEEARKALEAAQEVAHTAAQWHRLSTGYRALGDYPAALTALERALSLEEANPAWTLEAAALAVALLQYPKAHRWLQNLDPNNLPEPLRRQQRRLLATTQLATALPAQALSILNLWLEAETSLEEEEQDAYVWAGRARLAAYQHDTFAAQQALHQALDRLGHAPPTFENAPAWEEVALAALDLWEHEIAVETLRTLSDALPRRPRSALLLAQAVVHHAERRVLLHRAEALPQGYQEPSQAERDLWATALRRAAQGLGLEGNQPQDWVGSPLLGRCVLRGLALWTSEVRPGDLLEGNPTPPDVAASLLAAWRKGRRLPRIPKTLPHLEHPEVQATLAILMQDARQALGYAQQAVEQSPGNPVFHALRGRLALEQGDAAQALQAYQAALTLEPDNPRWHARAAQAAEQLGETGLLLHHLEQAARLEPASLERALALAQAYARHGQGERALEALRAAEGAHGQNPDLLLAFASIHRALGQREEALARLQQAHALAPERTDIVLALAEHYLEEGKPSQASALLEGLPVAEAQSERAVLLRARLAEAQGDARTAISLLEQAAAQAENPLPLLIARAEALSRAQGPKAAVEAWQALTEIRPDLPLLWAHLAEALAAAGQPQPAQHAARKALRGLERLGPEQQARLHLLLGRLARQQGHLDQAVHHLTEAIALHPTAEAYLELGRAEADRRRPDRALQALEQAMKLAPNDARPYYQAGLLYRDLHDYPQAERYLRRAAQLAPKDLAIRRTLAAVASINLIHPITADEG